MRDAKARSIAREGERGLDWFTFFCANLQTGFGPFVSVYLTSEKWTQTDIGLVLMCGSLVGLAGQMPGGALVDAAKSKRLITAVTVMLIGASALLVASSSLFIFILAAWILHALASCTLSPAIATLSLQLVGARDMGRRLGRNAAFASVGGAIAAAAMGGLGYYISNQAVFLITAALTIPALLALSTIHVGNAENDISPKSQNATRPPNLRRWLALLENRSVIIAASAIALFYLANAAMLPLVASILTLHSSTPTPLIAVCIIVPQLMVAILSPAVARKAQLWGRRPLLIICFGVLIIRGVGFGFIHEPYLLALIQVLDGVSSSILVILVPLIASDLTAKCGGFAVTQGLMGTAMGLGAAFSSSLGGLLIDRFGSQTAFIGLASIAILGLYIVWRWMPETRPAEDS